VRLGTFLERADNVAHTLALQAHRCATAARGRTWSSGSASCARAARLGYALCLLALAQVVEFSSTRGRRVCASAPAGVEGPRPPRYRDIPRARQPARSAFSPLSSSTRRWTRSSRADCRAT
jgi:hypothetical protein